MKRMKFSTIRLTVVAGSLVLLTACATTKPEESSGNGTGEKAGNSSSEPGAATSAPSRRTVSAGPNGRYQASGQTGSASTVTIPKLNTRIPLAVKEVNIRSAASGKSRIVARLQGGKQIVVLEEKGNWQKIRWQEDEKSREGWLYKSYVERIP